MSRYIEADKVLKELHLNYKDVIYIDKNDTAKRIEKIPNIDIVRCKECRFGQWHEQAEEYICIAHDQDLFDAEHFCSYGERKATEITTDCSWK